MQNKTENAKVALVKTKTEYPSSINPPKLYSEFQKVPLHDKFDKNNFVFEAIREAFILLNFDSQKINTPDWNPLGLIIKPGNTVLLKPNFVLHKSYNKETTLEVLITHPSVIFAVLDYVILALQGKGKIIIGDAPIQEAEFDKIISQLNIENILKQYKLKTNIEIEIIDFRKERSINKKYREIQRINLSGDPRGYSIINLGERSNFFEITQDSFLFRVTNYDKEKMSQFHNLNRHAYVITNSALEADVIISLPKLKTHRKAGLTCALKNLIGINGSKDCLPHHRKGSIKEGGDEYKNKSLRKKINSNIEEKRAQSKSSFICFILYFLKMVIYFSEKIFPYKDPYKEGSWFGNSTVPRTLVDLNYIINFASANGEIKDLTQKRKFLSVTDAILGGEKEGPLLPTKKEIGYIIISQDFIANDIISSYLVGFDPQKIPSLTFSLNSNININEIQSTEKIHLISNDPKFKNTADLIKNNNIKFTPSKGWIGYIELENDK